MLHGWPWQERSAAGWLTPCAWPALLKPSLHLQLTAIGGAVHVKREELAHKVLLRGAQQRLVLSHHKVTVLGQEVVGAVRHRACKRGGWGDSAGRLRTMDGAWGVTDQEVTGPSTLKQLLHSVGLGAAQYSTIQPSTAPCAHLRSGRW